jgi:hypothetical protein
MLRRMRSGLTPTHPPWEYKHKTADAPAVGRLAGVAAAGASRAVRGLVHGEEPGGAGEAANLPQLRGPARLAELALRARVLVVVEAPSGTQ